MSWIQPVYDRTEGEVEYAGKLNAKGDYDYLNDYICYLGEMEAGEDTAPSSDSEIVDWDAGLKGTLNASDLERIEGDVAILAADLNIEAATYEGRIPDTPQESYYRNLLKNVAAIREQHPTRDTPEVPEEPLNTFQKWNDIEEILDRVHSYIENRYFPRCGSDTFCGEGGLLL